MKRMRVSDLAERDLGEIWYFVAKNSHSMEIANGVVDSITSHFLLLAHTQESGTRRDELASGIRGFPVGNYIIYYRDSGSRVIISRVIHGMRDQKIAYFTGD